MKRQNLAALAIAKPKVALAVWFSLVGILALVGLNVESKLHRSDLAIPGSTTAKTLQSLDPKFGQAFDELILLKGPRAAVDVQGRGLSDELERIHGVSLVAPWIGANNSLRPTDRTALIVVRARGDFDHVSKELAPQIRELAKSSVHGPVSSYVSGYPDIADGIHGGTVKAIEQAELVAVPLLIIILLLVFRSPIAAALPLLMGFCTIGAARGMLALINDAYPLDALALNIASMMGLALGVDYALLMVSRFREELGPGVSTRQAALSAAQQTGHTILSAGIALAVAMATAILVVPGSLLVGVGVALISAVVLSVLGALIALPATLALLGTNVDRWTFGKVGGRSVGLLAVRALKHPAFSIAWVLVVVGLLAVPALGLNTGPPDPRALPAGEARDDYLEVRKTLGGGWIAPYEIVVTSDDGPLTDPGRLAAIDRFQRRMIARPDVAAVLGPGQIVRRTRPLRRAPKQLAGTRRFLREGLANQTELAHGLSRIGDGVLQMRGGLSTAAVAAGQLSAGGDSAASAAGQLHSGLGEAGDGVEKLEDGMVQARRAVGALAAGSQRASQAAGKLEDGLAAARPGLSKGVPQIETLQSRLDAQAKELEHLEVPTAATQEGLERGLAALEGMDSTAKLDPGYTRAYSAFAGALRAISGRDAGTGQPVNPDYDGLDAALAASSEEVQIAADGVAALYQQTRSLAAALGRLRSGSAQLEKGLTRLSAGAERLSGGFDRLASGGGDLAGGLSRLQAGSGRLASGVQRLAGGAGLLQSGLVEGASRVATLRDGLSKTLSGVLVFRGKTHRLSGQAQQSGKLTPAFESGYFTLAALDRAPSGQRRTAAFALNIDRGGGGARISVIGYGNPQKAGHPLRAVLERELGPLSRATHARAQLGGTATGVQDFDIATSDRLPLLAISLSLVTLVVLIGVLRSLLLPLIAVAFNLLTVGAAFGITVFFFQGSNPLLGGPGFIDAITSFGIFAIMFGLSIDYEVFLLLRMREGYELTGTTEGAIKYGVERTAGVITGAAMIMTVVFLAFATTGITAAKQLGLALSVAVVVDATLIRLVLLPATMKLCGRANWWLPKPLRRLLEPPAAPAAAPPAAAKVAPAAEGGGP